MKLPLQISFKNMLRSEALSSLIRERAQKLDRFCKDVIQCRVTVAVPHRSHHKGNFLAVNIEVRLPGKTVMVSHESNDDEANKDPYHVLKEAFDAAYRQVEDYNRMREDVA